MQLKSMWGGAGLISLALLVAACGGSSGTASETSAPAAASSAAASEAASEAASAEASSAPAADSWYPTPVTVWDTRGFDGPGVEEEYSPIGVASKPWNICASFPHMKDAYWAAANYGVIQEAEAANVNMTVVEAGGYENLDKQIQQIEDCAQSSDAVIIGAISFDGINRTVDKLIADGKVVIDLINGVSTPNTTAQSVISYRAIAATTGEYLVGQAAGQPVKVAWFPGPKGAGFAEEANKGFVESLAGSGVELVSTNWGDTGKEAQTQLIEDALAADPDINYIAGTAVTAEAAGPVLRDRGLTDSIGVLAYYMTPGSYQGIENGSVLAAAADPAVLTSRISVDLAVRALEGAEFATHVAPALDVVDAANIATWNRSTTLAPDDWQPVFSFQAK